MNDRPDYDISSAPENNPPAIPFSRVQHVVSRPLPPIVEPVILTWNRSSVPSSSSSTQVQSQTSFHENHQEYVLNYSCKIYYCLTWACEGSYTINQASGLTHRQATTYSFSPLADSSNCMILVPSADALDSRPPYNLSVSLNCFMPLSSILTIRRGANNSGELVGEFE